MDFLRNVLSSFEISLDIRAVSLPCFSACGVFSTLDWWQTNFWDRNINDGFPKSRPYSANLFKLHMDRIHVWTSVRRQISSPVSISKAANPESGFTDCLTHCLHLSRALHSLSLGQLRFLLPARDDPHFQLTDQIFLPSFTGERLKPESSSSMTQQPRQKAGPVSAQGYSSNPLLDIRHSWYFSSVNDLWWYLPQRPVSLVPRFCLGSICLPEDQRPLSTSPTYPCSAKPSSCFLPPRWHFQPFIFSKFPGSYLIYFLLHSVQSCLVCQVS